MKYQFDQHNSKNDLSHHLYRYPSLCFTGIATADEALGDAMMISMGCSLASQPYFSAYAHAHAKVGGGGKEKYAIANARAKVAEGRKEKYANERAKVGGEPEGRKSTRMRIRGKILLARETTKFYNNNYYRSTLTKFSGK